MKYTKQEVSIWALGMCGGCDGYVNIQDIAVKAFKAYPRLFSLAKYPEYPDIDSCRTVIQHAKKTKAGAMVTQSALGSSRQNFALAPIGVSWFKKHKSEIERLSAQEVDVGGSSSAESVKKLVEREVGSIQAYAEFASGKKTLRQNDFYKVFNISAGTPRETYERHKTSILAAMSGAPEYEYIRALAQKFGDTLIREDEENED
jgi:hypothetical protein